MTSLTLPELKKGDLMLIISSNQEPPVLFYSDGRVAQTDCTIDYHAEKERIPFEQLPDELRRYFEYRDDHCYHFSARMDKPHWNAWNSDEHYMFRQFLISRAIEQGHLKDYLHIFGQDDDVDHEIAHTTNPLCIFGYEKQRGALCLSTPRETRFDFDGRAFAYKTLEPSNAQTRNGILTFKTDGIESMVVGSSAIIERLKGTPLEFYVQKGVILPEESD